MAAKKSRARQGSKKPISILLIGSNPLVQMGLAALMKRQEGLRLLATARKPEPAVVLGRGQRPDVILLGEGSWERRPEQIIRGIQADYPEASLMVMGVIPFQSDILGLVRLGVCGLVLKDASIRELVASIGAIAAGRKVLPAALAATLFGQIVVDVHRKCGASLADVKMTNREREIVDLIAGGLSNKEIAKKLCIATDTVKSHVHNILEKLALHSRLEIAAYHHSEGGSGQD
jgi:two-component system nitrate/nitrite response regulator NarL